MISPPNGSAGPGEPNTYTPEDVSVSADRVLRIQGYVDPGKVRPVIARAAQESSRLVEALIRPVVFYRRLAIERRDGGRIVLAGGGTLENPGFKRYLANAVEVVVFALTAGARLDEEMDHFMRSDRLLDAVLLESAAWMGLEEVTKAFVIKVRADVAADGLRLTRRMGPGYTYRTDDGEALWPLEDQPRLFDVLGDVSDSIRLLDSCAMLPKMSRSGLFGLVPSSRGA